MGGRSSGGGHLCDVWCSTDGGNWVRCRDATWGARGAHTATVRADTLWVMGGNTGGLQFKNDVYYTTDGGENWFPLDLPANNLEPRGIALNPGNSSKLYLWTRSWNANLITINRVYLSTDAGATWLPEPLFEQRGYQAQIRTLGGTIIRNTLFISPHQYPAQRAELLDALGRKVTQLSLGTNDVRHLRTGVYFILARSASDYYQIATQHCRIT